MALLATFRRTTSNPRLQRLAHIGLVFLGIRAERNYKRLPELQPVTNLPESLPSLSIIIPSRNEAHNLPRLLASLNQLNYPGDLEIIVVDDASTDRSAEIAENSGARVLRLDGPPPGWTGKTFACHSGAGIAKGDWLLFTDADTWHSPWSAASATVAAMRRGLDGISMFLGQENSSAADRVALMVAHAGYFVGLANPRGALNGQYILVKKPVYVASGGFAAVRNQATEDLALGKRWQRQGYSVQLMRGEEAGRVQMYRDLPSMWLGLSRFAVTSLRWTGFSSLLAVLFTILVAAPLDIWPAGGNRRERLSNIAEGWLTAVAATLAWARRFGGWHWSLLAPVGAIQVQFAAIWGILRRLSGRGVKWKERTL